MVNHTFLIFSVFFRMEARILCFFFSRSFNINRVAAQAVEDVLNIGEYRNSYSVLWNYCVRCNVHAMCLLFCDVQ